MTKAEFIELYGIERYEAHKAKNNAYCKDQYKNDPEFRKTCKALRSTQRRESYCRAGELERIENYELAKAYNFKGWDIHHRLELTLDGARALTV